jgi:hypothetical protein
MLKQIAIFKSSLPLVVLVILCLAAINVSANRSYADDFESFLQPLVAENCARCHGGKKTKGKVNLKEITTAKHLLEKPKLIENLIDAIDANDMPPEDEPQLDTKTRIRMLATLKAMLHQATVGKTTKQIQIRRLNRFQYNNTVKELFQLKLDVFKLPEKLMTRRGNYLHKNTGAMPKRVKVASHSLSPIGGLSQVNAFPKDLRAAHGFDNQSNQLTLSPLLLDAFLRLSVSIVESPDFKESNVGIWNDFFKEPPANSDKQAEVERRLASFLNLAFRRPVAAETLDRYTAYVMAKLKQNVPFTQCMKKVASAALSSPMFLYRSIAGDSKESQFELASKLSYFLWNSCPDVELLQQAEAGKLTDPVTLSKTIDRMLADPKIEGFLDAFPSQWMQLENVLAATPDPKKSRYFAFDKSKPASLQMVIEPLLLFDAVFIEDRPIIELIAPTFSYQSDFLKTWYTTDLKPPKYDATKLIETNRINAEKRVALAATIKTTKNALDALVQPTKDKLLAARKAPGAKKPIDLKPYAAWEFDGNLNDSANKLNLKAHGKIQYNDGMVVLKRSFLQSSKLPIDLKAKSLEVWCRVPQLNQRGGGLMGIQGAGDFFDTIVLGERKKHHWISGSNGHRRTADFPNSTPETKVDQMLHLVMVYDQDGTTTLYRDGKPYGKPYRKGAATFPKNQSSVIFGLRHLPPGGNKYLSVTIDKARLYNRALTAEEVTASNTGSNLYISEMELVKALSNDHKAQRQAYIKRITDTEADLKRVPQPYDIKKGKQNVVRRYEDQMRSMLRSQDFERVPTTDPRYGGIITNAAMLSMTSGPKRTHPIARGAWVIEVIFNDPPAPPPNDVPPLNENQTSNKLTIREKFAAHRENPSCAGCHSRLDPLGFALESFDITGRWRDKYENGRDVDASGTLMKTYKFQDVVEFKATLVKEETRFAKAFTAHLLRFGLSRELTPADSLVVDDIIKNTKQDHYKFRSLIKQIVLSKSFNTKSN